jgi:UDP-glucose 4-epimerase
MLKLPHPAERDCGAVNCMDYNKYSKILVTGAAGFIGSHLVDYLINHGLLVYGVDDLSGGYLRNVNKKSDFTQLDLRDRNKVEKYICQVKPDLIYHLAADATEGRSHFTPLECTDRNYLAYLNLLVPAIKNCLKKIIITSSMSVYGSQTPPFTEDILTKPEDIYGIAKAAIEQATKVLATVHGFEYVIIRPHNVYGPRQNKADPYRNVVAIFINKLLEGKPFYIYGDGEQKRAFTYIDDCVQPLADSAFIKDLNGEIFNVGPEEEITINELARIVIEEFFETEKARKDITPIHLSERPQEVKFAYSSSKKARRLLNYQPKIKLKEGIKRCIIWAKDIGYEKPKYLDELELVSQSMPITWKDRLI